MSKIDELDKLFEEWSNNELHKNHHPFIKDGIVNEDEWKKQPAGKHFLFILKEAYGEEGSEDWYLNKWLNKSDDNGPKGYKSDKTWKEIIKWANGLINTTKNKIEAYKSDFQDYDILKKIAVMNLKKTNGISQSNNDDILKYVDNDKDFIVNEINIIDPDVIICCGNIFYLNSVFNEIKLNDSYYCFSNSSVSKNRLFILYNHPSAFIKKAYLYYGLMSIYQQALIEMN